MTEEKFLTGMAVLYTLYGKTLSDDALKLYRNILRKFSDEQFEKMLENITMSFKPTSQVPFPLPVHFTESIGLSSENRAQAAVTAVKNAAERWGAWSTVDFGDPALHAVINRFGGWPEVCSWGNAGQWKFTETKFMEAYEAAVVCGESASPCAGNHELENLGKDTAGWTPFKIEINKKNIEPKSIEWIGADFSHQIENKKQEPKRIAYGPDKVSDILSA